MEIEGMVKKVIYQTDKSEYKVFNIGQEDGNENIVCTGEIPSIYEGEEVCVFGDYVEHKTYGKQFKVSSFRPALPKTIKGYKRYLQTTIRGIGPVTAEKIVDAFGDDTFDVISNCPEKLAAISGISKRKAEKISIQFTAQSMTREEQMMFIALEISDTQAAAIKKKFRNNYKDILYSNPYVLIGDIPRLGFVQADKIAEKVGIPHESPIRVKALIKYTLEQYGIVKGHTCYPYTDFINEISKSLDVEKQVVEDIVYELIHDKSLVKRSDYIFTAAYDYMEQNIANKVIEMSSDIVYRKDKEKLLDQIRKIEDKNSVTLDETQRDAVYRGIVKKMSIITGGPGVGKTTTLNILIKFLESEHESVTLAAPTGRAAKRMTEQTGREASTIHRLIGFCSFDSELSDSNGEIDADTIIIDEMSMVDTALMHNLLNAVNDTTRVVLVGDVDQLPSVGAGSVLKDLIESGVITVSRLTKIHRQAEQSHIITYAHKINNLEPIDYDEKFDDFFFLPRRESAVETALNLYTKVLPKQFGINAIETQILCPMRKGSMGVEKMNRILQDAVNPSAPDKKEICFGGTVFREGDKVMHIKNDYGITCTYKNGSEARGVFNGEIGFVKKIDKEDEMVYVLYDDCRLAEYDYESLQELTLAYATTIHKSQGSEFPVVIIPLVQSGPPMLYNKNLLYTAVTRAKLCVILIGEKKVVVNMAKNEKANIRYTGLKSRLFNATKNSSEIISK